MKLALPSKGELATPTLAFLAAAGLDVFRPNERQYTASIPSLPYVEVLFQRAPDVYTKVAEGNVDLGITGYDIVCEQSESHDDVIVLYDKLGYGACRLVVAVPESWIDVSSLEDLADLTVHYRSKGRELKIATKFPNSTRNWLYEKGIYYFKLVEAEGALEVAPNLGYADLIVDITSTGTTLRENRLKQIRGGTIIKSQACLIGNQRLLDTANVIPGKLDSVRLLLEHIEANRKAKDFVTITANVCGESEQAVAQALMKERNLVGLRGPSIAKVYSKFPGEDEWYAVTIIIEKDNMQATVDHLRKTGGTDITVLSPKYLYDSKSWHFENLLEKLKRGVVRS